MALRMIGLLLFFVFATGVAIAETQQILDMGPADQKRLSDQRALIEKYLGDDTSKANYQKPAGKLGLLRALLNQKVFRPNQTLELQSMGVVLGDTFVQDLGFRWVIIQDEHGAGPAIRYKNTGIILHPLTMISKRIEKGELVDVFDLYNGVAAIAEEKIKQIDTKMP